MKSNTSIIALISLLSLAFCNVKAQFPALPSYSVQVIDSSFKGFYFLSPHKPDPVKSPFSSFNMILDHNGNIVYLKKFNGNRKLADFKLQRNGFMSYYFYDRFYIMDGSFKIKDSIQFKKGFSKDPHDLQALANGNYALLACETIDVKAETLPFKLKEILSGSAVPLYAGVILELNPQKKIIFEWHCKDHFKLKDMDTSYISGSSIDWTHCNSIELCSDGNFLLSSRNFNELTKISRKDGHIIWRLGGKANQFKFSNETDTFIAQHDARELQNGHITLFDNGKQTKTLHPASAKEYELDEKSHIAKLVWNYTNQPETHSFQGLGNVVRMQKGYTLINYGKSADSQVMFNVVNSKGNKIFEINFEDSLRSYRVFNYTTLPFSIKRPSIIRFKKDGKTYLDAGSSYKNYHWKSGETTQVIEVHSAGSYQVFVPVGDGGFVSSTPYLIKDF